MRNVPYPKAASGDKASKFESKSLNARFHSREMSKLNTARNGVNCVCERERLAKRCSDLKDSVEAATDDDPAHRGVPRQLAQSQMAKDIRASNSPRLSIASARTAKAKASSMCEKGTASAAGVQPR